ncbi:MAG: hypothetical protein ABI945_10790 [Nitrospirales bacterium]
MSIQDGHVRHKRPGDGDVVSETEPGDSTLNPGAIPDAGEVLIVVDTARDGG